MVTKNATRTTNFTLLSPAEFDVTDLVINPEEALAGEEVAISVRVENIGDVESTYTVELEINDVVAKTRDVTQAPGKEETVVFTVTRDIAATYRVDVAVLTGDFVVRARPAEFTVTDLTVTPEEVYTGEEVTVTALVANVGDLTGTYEVILKIDDVVEASDEVTLAGGASREVSFTVTRDLAATFDVDVAGLTGDFVVLARLAKFTVTHLTIAPEEVYTGEGVTVTVLVTNVGELAGTHQVTLKIDDLVEATEEVALDGGASREVSFSVTRELAASYAVNLAGLTGAFVVKAVPFNWWLIVGIIAAVIVTGLVVFSVIRRRRAAWDEHRR